MISYTSNTNVSENETYTLKAPFVGWDYILYVSGVFDGATATFGYVDGSGDFAPFRNNLNEILTAESSNGYFVVGPPSRELAITLTNTGENTSVRFDVARKQG